MRKKKTRWEVGYNPPAIRNSRRAFDGFSASSYDLAASWIWQAISGACDTVGEIYEDTLRRACRERDKLPSSDTAGACDALSALIQAKDEPLFAYICRMADSYWNRLNAQERAYVKERAQQKVAAGIISSREVIW